MTMPDGLEEKLLENLRIYAFLKAIFSQKFHEIPFHIIKQYNHEEMARLKTYHKDVFLEKAYLLGFSKGRKVYKGFPKKEINEMDQAIDYIELLFCFDDTMHLTLTQQLGVPMDTLDEIENKNKYFKVKRKQKSFTRFYDYIEYLGD